MLISISIILAAIIIAYAIKTSNPEKPYTVSSTTSSSQVEIIKKESPVENFMNEVSGTK